MIWRLKFRTMLFPGILLIIVAMILACGEEGRLPPPPPLNPHWCHRCRSNDCSSYCRDSGTRFDNRSHHGRDRRPR